MNSMHKITTSIYRRAFSPSLILTLFLLSLIWTCNPKSLDQREELANSLKSENLDGFYYSVEEDETQLVSAFTNSAIENAITLDDNTTNAVIKYTLIKDKKANTKKLYKTEIINENKKISLIISDINSEEIVLRQAFPDPRQRPHDSIIAPPNFIDLGDCIDDFECITRPGLQCEANRTCKNQKASIICCISETQCVSLHFVITPNSFRCRLRDFSITALPDQGVFVRVEK